MKKIAFLCLALYLLSFPAFCEENENIAPAEVQETQETQSEGGDTPEMR